MHVFISVTLYHLLINIDVTAELPLTMTFPEDIGTLTVCTSLSIAAEKIVTASVALMDGSGT